MIFKTKPGVLMRKILLSIAIILIAVSCTNDENYNKALESISAQKYSDAVSLLIKARGEYDKTKVDEQLQLCFNNLVHKGDIKQANDLLIQSEPFEELNKKLKQSTKENIESLLKQKEWGAVLNILSIVSEKYINKYESDGYANEAYGIMAEDVDRKTDDIWDNKKNYMQVIVHEKLHDYHKLNEVTAYFDAGELILIIYEDRDLEDESGFSSRYYYEDGRLYYSSKKYFEYPEFKTKAKNFRYFVDGKMVFWKDLNGIIPPSSDKFKDMERGVLESAEKWYKKAINKLGR